MMFVLICCFVVVVLYIVSIDKFVFLGVFFVGVVVVGVASVVGVLALKSFRVDKAKSLGVVVVLMVSM